MSERHWAGPWLAAGCAFAIAACGGSDAGEGASGAGAASAADPADASVSVLTLSSEEIRRRVANHVGSQGDFVIVTDPLRNKQFRVSFVRVHEEVEATPGGRRSVCVDFRGQDGTLYVMQYWLGVSDGEVAVQDRLLHRVGDFHVAEDSVVARLDAEGVSGSG